MRERASVLAHRAEDLHGSTNASLAYVYVQNYVRISWGKSHVYIDACVRAQSPIRVCVCVFMYVYIIYVCTYGCTLLYIGGREICL